MLSGRPVMLVEMFARSGCGSTVPVVVLLVSHKLIRYQLDTPLCDPIVDGTI